MCAGRGKDLGDGDGRMEREERAGGRAGDGKEVGGFHFSSSSSSVFSFTAGQGGQRAGRQLSCPP